MPFPPRPQKQSHGWRNIACFAVLGLIALWTLSRAPRFEPRHEAAPDAHNSVLHYGSFSESNVKGSVAQQAVTPTGRFRLLLSTHNRLFWYYPDTQEDVAVHEGQGVYYGTFPGEPTGSDPTVWTVSRPHNWHPTSTTERLLNINTNSGQLLNSVQIPSRFSHDAVRSGNHIWLCNTGDGQLLQLSYPSMEVVRTLDLFTVKEHINTVAVFDSSSVWVVLHNLGRSAVVKVDLASGQVAQRYDNVGMNCHGLVMWRGLFVLLSSKETSLITLNPSTREVTYIWSADQGFLKGLAVVDDVAYFGISPPMERQNRDGPNVECDVVAVDLLTHEQVFRRKVATHGLLNIVSAPDLSEGSSYIAQRTPWGPPLRPDVPMVNQVALKTTVAKLITFQAGQADLVDTASEQAAFHTGQLGLSDDSAQVTTMQSDQTGVTDGAGVSIAGDSTALSTANGETPYRWSEAWLDHPLDESAASSKWLTSMPRMNLEVKVQAMGGSQMGRRAAISDLPVYLHLGKVIPELIRPAQARLAEMPAIWWDPQEQAKVSAVIADREDNLSKIKPGVRNMFLIFSSRSTDIVWELPLYHYYQSVLDPILEALLGKNVIKNIIRLQLAQMNPGAHIKPHRDTGPWAQTSHRIHVVLKTNPSISFFSCPQCGSSRDADIDKRCQPPPAGTCIPVDTALDNVFEINNLMIHEVLNTASEDRVHMVVDVLEEPAPERRVLQPGQQCHYVASDQQTNNPRC